MILTLLVSAAALALAVVGSAFVAPSGTSVPPTPAQWN